ncbi:MAG: hypothetical protein E5V60_04505 [Mesorhizobium sp.]|uniref:hypothetical protein n=1 Tax=Mesorhizobium sp. TaxID=1871066 RepID=UPI000FE79AE4|nr:hypothetical protein [Mesorhizobium sp.]RWP55560.1 MAG: hypothetical protein EOR08_33880 [Mesorhizobium sp.]TIW68544.1 MAG: hypothetical protein E5V60_04505 [Mesorhizobium sp.]
MVEANRRVFMKGATAVAIGGTTGLVGSAAQAANATDHEAFIALSITLTGLTAAELPAMVEQNDALGVRLKLYEIYFERLRFSYPAEFRELLVAWREIEDKPDHELALSEKLSGTDPAAGRLRVAARQVIKIWLLSTIDDPRTQPDLTTGKSNGQLGGDLGQYQNSAIWKLVGASVPGYSNASHGYWVNKPSLKLDTGAAHSVMPVSTEISLSGINTIVELPDG